MFDTVSLETSRETRLSTALWLLAFGFALAVVWMAQGIVTIMTAIGSENWTALTTPGSEAYHPLWQVAAGWELLTMFVLLPYACALLVYLSHRRRSFPKLAITWFLAGVIAAIVDQALVSRLPDSVLWGGFAAATEQMVAITIGAMIWTPYLLYSTRAKQLFTE